jgi:hypothetical protein
MKATGTLGERLQDHRKCNIKLEDMWDRIWMEEVSSLKLLDIAVGEVFKGLSRYPGAAILRLLISCRRGYDVPMNL